MKHGYANEQNINKIKIYMILMKDKNKDLETTDFESTRL